MFPIRRACALTALFWLAACGSTPPREDTPHRRFGEDLAAEYQAFAASEAEAGREASGEHFTRKAEDALAHGDAAPEDPAKWDLRHSDEADDLEGARKRLMRLRDQFMERVVSQNMARAQVLYDCWLLQTHARNADLADTCRSGFFNELRNLEPLAREDGAMPSSSSQPAESFTILFASGRAALDRDARYAIAQAHERATALPGYRVEVTGHSDSEGDAETNLALSEKRAKAVAQALIAAGLEAERIETVWLGQDDPQEPTLDGTARKSNRRVEIELSPDRHSHTPMQGDSE